MLMYFVFWIELSQSVGHALYRGKDEVYFRSPVCGLSTHPSETGTLA